MKCWKKDKQKINDFREYLHDLEVKSGLFESLPATETLRHFTSSHNYRVYVEKESQDSHLTDRGATKSTRGKQLRSHTHRRSRLD